MAYYLETVDEVMADVNASYSGLTDAEVDQRRAEYGLNELPQEPPRSLAARFLDQISDPMLIILLVAALVSLVLAIIEHGGFNEYAEVGIIFFVVIVNCVLGVVQESKAEKAIEALQKMSGATAKVRRNGHVVEIPTAEIVPGDIVNLEAGDAVPADMRLIEAASFRVEESALTGESVPTDKTTEPLVDDHQAGEIPLGDRENMAFMGSAVVYGRGAGVVTGTGSHTEMGKISTMLATTKEGLTPLQLKLAQLSKILTWLVLGICVVVFALQLFRAGTINRDTILNSFMLAVSLAVAAIPEGLVAVVTIVLSLGVTRMAQRKAIVRKLPAVETLGCTQVICSDKTGTITQNKMTVVDTYGSDLDLLARSMALCSDSQLAADGNIVGDPTENALISYALTRNFDKNQLEAQYPRLAEAPFDSERKLMSTINEVDGRVVQYTKGAPDELLRRCTHMLVDGQVVPLTDELRAEIHAQISGFSDRALRVLGSAYRDYPATPSFAKPEEIESDLTFIGLVAMIDPIRPEVFDAVQKCRSAGINIVMATGDSKPTAVAIGKELGIITDDSQAVTGRELDLMSDEEFEQRVRDIHIYARVQPENKVRIVQMWQKLGYVAAMTGDGVNDSPALKSADIGVGMGITGTDVSKGVSDIVLGDDNFSTIVDAVGEGRRIYDNIRKTIQFLLSSNLSEIIVILVSTLMGFTVFRPIHLLFINLLTDTVPAVALGLEEAEPDVMGQQPRSSRDGIFSGGLGFNIIYQGLLTTALVLGAYFIVRFVWHDSPTTAITAAFVTMSICEVVQAYALRSIDKSVFRLGTTNRFIWFAIILSLLCTAAVVYIPVLAGIFQLTPLGPRELLLALALAAVILPIIEIVKWFQRRNRPSNLAVPPTPQPVVSEQEYAMLTQ